MMLSVARVCEKIAVRRGPAAPLISSSMNLWVGRGGLSIFFFCIA
jgi:hypothetical protein